MPRAPRSLAVAIDLPAGEHSLFIPMRDLGDPSLIEVRGPDGLRIGAPVPLDRIAIAEGSSTARRRPGRARPWRRPRTARRRRRARAARCRDTGLADATRLPDGLTRGGPEGVAMPTDPATLSALLATLGTETGRINTELQAARETRRATKT
jgi:hypothetical protein